MNQEDRSPDNFILNPCRHMESYVSALSDGSLSGLARYYALWHVAGCSRCRATLEALKQLRARLSRIGGASAKCPEETLDGPRRLKLENALDEVDERIP